MRIVKTYTFEAAHYLPATPDGHPCGRMHGHSYRVDVHIVGPVDPDAGWVMDFGAIDSAWARAKSCLDHDVLNETIINPTCEHVAVWLWRQLAMTLPVARVVVWETADARCEYEGEQ